MDLDVGDRDCELFVCLCLNGGVMDDDNREEEELVGWVETTSPGFKKHFKIRGQINICVVVMC